MRISDWSSRRVLFRSSDTKIIVYSDSLTASVRQAQDNDIPTLTMALRDGGAAGPDRLSDVLDAADPLPATPRPGTDELFMYTGGTTGSPRGGGWRRWEERREGKEWVSTCRCRGGAYT